jgi:hypothetical protein
LLVGGQGNSTYFSKPGNRQKPERFLTAMAKNANKMCESMLFSFPFRLFRRCGQSFFQRLYNFEGILVFQKVSAVALVGGWLIL